MSASRDDVVRYRLGCAYRSIEEARVLSEARLWTACVSHLYYACFYASTALLATEKLESKKHSGVQSFFNKHLVNTGRFPAEIAQVYNRLLSYRSRIDYRDFIDADEETVSTYSPKAAAFVACAADILKREHGISIDS